MAWQQINGIPFRPIDDKNLRKAVNRYNRKLRRIQKKYENEDNVMLPDLLNVRSLKEDIKTRKDLNNQLKSIERFMKRGSEELLPPNEAGVVLTKYQRNEIRIGIIRSKANLRKQIEKLEEIRVDTDNPSLNFARYRFKTDEISNLKTKMESLNNVNKRDKQGLRNLIQRIGKYSSQTRLHKQNIIYKENYIEALSKVFKYANGFDELIEKLEKIDPDEFYKMIAFDDIVSDIKYIYDEKSKGQEGDLDGLFEKISNTWEKTLQERR